MLALLVGMGSMLDTSVCLFVQSTTQKQKQSVQTWYREWVSDLGLGFQGHGLWLGLSQQQYGVCLNSMNAV